MRRRLLILALLPTLLDPLALFARAWAAAEHECRDHVCICVRLCPPKRSQRQPCHGSAEEGPAMRGVCHHDQATTLASGAPAVLPAESWNAVAPTVTPQGRPLVTQSLPSGFPRIDPPPPKPF